ncbi:hypothetical protein [Parachitinimonas caeni]|uniref:Uncharacterized protein n=1 Tax=Parachitinimonas caeni TaxID=3031301 RepID=A0ABT7E2J9_9NEIS|nr:hypothetical protein [Parachitinimonas caeni]MDK2126546.1 hypothetical protein [Parachitinimonas caeni]
MANQRTPGPVGLSPDTAASAPTIQTTSRAAHTDPGAKPDQATQPMPDFDADTVLLAAVAYGEASVESPIEELTAIAQVLVRRAKATGHTKIKAYLEADPTFAYAAVDGNARFKLLSKAKPETRWADPGMRRALQGARNAIENIGTDYSNGAYFWDGKDLKSNYTNHPKVKAGIKFDQPEHNIFDVKESAKAGITYWQVPDKHGKLVNGRERGRYDTVYISTAAWGQTVFWKHPDDYLKAVSGKAWK